MADLEVRQGLTGMRITGLKETLRALEKTGTQAGDLKAVMREIAQLIISAVRAPIRPGSGRLSGSVRPGAAKQKAIVYAGNGRRGKNGVPYAGVIHYGWPERNIPARPFLDQARAAKIDEATEKLVKELGHLADINRLENNF